MTATRSSARADGTIPLLLPDGRVDVDVVVKLGGGEGHTPRVTPFSPFVKPLIACPTLGEWYCTCPIENPHSPN